ncbi:hypothetical protein ABEF95_014569 [Exophiala dermatitidis]
MDSEEQLVDSPIQDEGTQSENPSADSATTIESSPLPTRPGYHQSPRTARKRTNEEVYESVKSLKTPSTPSRFQKSSNVVPQPQEEPQPSATPIARPVPNSQGIRPNKATATNDTGAEGMVTTNHNVGSLQETQNSFVKDIEDYRQQLELEFQEFERSLDERDPAADLEPMDWDDLEAQYNKEVQSKVAAEQEIMSEFSARFEQFMLYMQVSADYEAERAIKRLRTRIAITRNTETALAQKQAHHAKVLEAFQSAMNLLNT